jgi:hypothetical protein
LVDLGLERQHDRHPVDTPLHALDAPRAPRPHLRCM